MKCEWCGDAATEEIETPEEYPQSGSIVHLCEHCAREFGLKD